MDFNDMFPSRFLKAIDAAKGALILTIKSVTIEEVGEEEEKKPVVWFEGQDKGLVLNKTNGAMLASDFGINTDDWVGKVVKLVVEKTLYKGKKMDALRVYKADSQSRPAAVVGYAVPEPLMPAAEVRADPIRVAVGSNVTGEGEAGFTVTGVKQPRAGIFIIEAYCTGMGESSGTLFRTPNKDWALAAKAMIGKEGPVDIAWKTAADNFREIVRLDTELPF